MRKVAVLFLLAVIIPSLVLAWLAVRSLRDQQFVIERQRSLLYQGVTDALARQATTLLAERLHELGAHVEELLTGMPAEELARTFDEELRARWSAATVGFVVTPRGELLSPPPNGRPQARAFRSDHGAFLGNRESVEVYLNLKQAPPDSQISSLNERLSNEEARSPGSAAARAESDAESRFLRTRASQTAVRTITPEKSKGPLPGTAATDLSGQAAMEAQLSRITPAEANFQQLIGESAEGTLARFVNNRLNLLYWYRSPRDVRYIFGAQLELNRFKDELRDRLPGFETALRNDICLAILDDAARPVALSHPDFNADWRRPFVATEIGELLPHWEATAYLLNPDKLTHSARTIRFTLGLLILLLLLAIGVGSWLIVRDLNRQLTLARQKTDFVSNVSHELKTPLTSIRMFTELLGEGGLEEPGKQRAYVNIIAAETARLTRLINNVLDFSRLERGEKKYQFRACDLARIASETAETYRPHLENSGFNLELNIPETPLPVHGDCDALAQVIVNLLSNAEKYSTRQKEIRIEAERVDGMSPRVEIRVLDRGSGVPTGAEEKIFEKFYRAHDSLSSGVQGSGLGLTLARQIARAHGGDVQYAARREGGSCFVLRLPLLEDTNTPAT